MTQKRRKVVILGGGFAGLTAARRINQELFAVTLIDRNNFHLFQPLLYQVATGYLAPSDIATPLRRILARRSNVQVIKDEVTVLDPIARTVITANQSYAYDYLLIAVGVTHSYFGHDDWQPFAPGLKGVADAIEMRRRILSAFETAERITDPIEQRKLLTFVVVGGGPTGVELAGTIAELARSTLRGEFRRIDPLSVDIILIEAGERVLGSFGENSSRYANRALARLGVRVFTSTMVRKIDKAGVEIAHPDNTLTRVATRTVLWAAGVAATPLASTMAARLGAERDRSGRIKVGADLSILGHPEIFVLGDLALVEQEPGSPLPGIAPVAMQQGAYLAELLSYRVREVPVCPFCYADRGIMAIIGRGHAVAETRRLRLTGYSAWLAWAFVHIYFRTSIFHIYFLIDFEDRVVVFLHWAWNYLTNRRSSLIIT